MRNHATTSRRGLNQRGVSSILFTLIMMIIISLIVVSFAQLARRGQRESLDAQLSNQAYYAAESGVNDARNAIQQLANANNLQDNPGCSISAAYATYIPSATIDATNNVSYTCLRVDLTPQTLTASNLIPGRSQVFYLNPSGPLTGITFSWTAGLPPTVITSCPNPGTADPYFDTVSNWTSTCPYAVMRIDLVPTAGGNLNRASLQASTMTVFAVPYVSMAVAGPVTYSLVSPPQGIRGFGACQSNATCTMTINGLSQTSYAMRVMAMYTSAPTVTIAAVPSTTSWNGGQALIDVTGKAQDVLRRIQVRVPLTINGGSYSDFALGSKEDICKNFRIDSTNNNLYDDPGCKSF